jgi:hypothetical protein
VTWRVGELSYGAVMVLRRPKPSYVAEVTMLLASVTLVGRPRAKLYPVWVVCPSAF